ncbi:MAG TPA: ANTAR domain-containing protein [Jatrophihabitans sp.]|nr:ANTAR domain-containing protein [Jatrophihabitans sp.]
MADLQVPTTQQDGAADTHFELAVGIAEVIGNLAGGTEMPGPQAIAPLLGAIVEAMPQARCASVVSRPTRQKPPATFAATEQLAADLDQLQIKVNEGPCLDSLGATELLRVDDLADDPRWPALAGLGRPLPIRSVLSVPVYCCDGTAHSLSLYAERPATFGPAQHSTACLCAAALGLAVSALHEHERVSHLRVALGTNRQIGAAMGILMARHRCNSDEAFTALRVASQHLHRKLRDIADEVVFTGVLPGRRDRRPWPRPAT